MTPPCPEKAAGTGGSVRRADARQRPPARPGRSGAWGTYGALLPAGETQASSPAMIFLTTHEIFSTENGLTT